MAGGGIDMLALPTFPPTVPTSANLLFLFVVVDDAELLSSEWEGVRAFGPVDGPGESKGSSGSVTASCRPLSPECTSEVCEDTALS